MNIRQELEKRISDALTAAVGGDTPLPAIVAPAANSKFGDYQANGVMAAAKQAKCNPRELAGKVLEHLDLSDIADNVEIAGPGFINITLRDDALAAYVARAADDERLGVAAIADPQTIVVDYSHPNIAKEMHVGHLRSTVIGDSLVRTLEFLGHKLVRANHVGDWGTQFGMLIAYLDRTGGDADDLADLEAFYRQAQELFASDADFADTARQYVVRLQSGDKEILRSWQRFIDESLDHCQRICDLLAVSLTRDDVRGESSYNDDLSNVVADLAAKELLEESDGAQCVFLDEFKGKDDEPLPVIVQKSDGGYLYATTDLAAIRYRVGELYADRILYIVDARQNLHLAQVFAVARAAGYAEEDVSLEHHAFGTILGSDGRPFKTRSGDTVKLMDLLREAVERAAAVVAEKNPELPAEQRERIAQVVGIGAVKYADLSMDRTSDYKFSWDKMLALQGNTAPYMQYAYARVRSIFRKGAEDVGDLAGTPITLAEQAERELATRLCRLEEVLTAVASECKPNILTAYLFDLAGAFSSFYEACPVLKADPEIRASRLRLCELTARTIKLGLSLLGIDVIEQM